MEEIGFIESTYRTRTMSQDLWKQYEKTLNELVAIWRDVLLSYYRFFEGTIPIANDGANVLLKMWFPYIIKLKNQNSNR